MKKKIELKKQLKPKSKRVVCNEEQIREEGNKTESSKRSLMRSENKYFFQPWSDPFYLCLIRHVNMDYSKNKITLAYTLSNRVRKFGVKAKQG